MSCTGLKNEWKSTIETSTQFPVNPGTVVEVTCSDSRALTKGSSEVTCISETEFNFKFNEPKCMNQGIEADAVNNN